MEKSREVRKRQQGARKADWREDQEVEQVCREHWKKELEEERVSLRRERTGR